MASKEDGMETVLCFLRERGHNNDIIKKFTENRIDANAIGFMEDGELEKYLPAFGDRVKLRQICKATTPKKVALFAKLRKKMGLEPHDDNAPLEDGKRTKSYNLRGNKNAKKPTRKFELGWLHDGKQVRGVNGGGSRKVELSRDAKKCDILKYAKEVFFPKGVSKKGLKLSDIECTILDFAQTEFPDNISLAEMYDTVKMGILRFHLSTKSSEDDNTCESAKDVLPSTCSKTASTFIELGVNNDLSETTSLCTDEEITRYLTVNEQKSSSAGCSYSTNDTESQIDEIRDTIPVTASNSFEAECSFIPDVPLVAYVPLEVVLNTEEQEHPGESLDIPRDPEEQEHPGESLEIPRGPEEQEHQDTSLEIPRSPTPPFATDVDEPVLIRIHRVNIMQELIQIFKDPSISCKCITFSFVDESGSDASGVSRDVYSSFWADFFSRRAEGEDVRVPALNPHWQGEEWMSVGRILAKGFLDLGFFPIHLAPAFTIALLFGGTFR